jgi:hypothetical protein
MKVYIVYVGFPDGGNAAIKAYGNEEHAKLHAAKFDKPLHPDDEYSVTLGEYLGISFATIESLEVES